MPPHNDRTAAASREQARARLRNLTRFAVFATTGAAAGIGLLIAHEHPGSSGASATKSGDSSGATAPSSSSSGNSGSSSTSNTGNSGSSSAPSTSSQTPAVTSGGTGR